MTPPVCTLIAGPNGAGKTTFARRFLSDHRNFINADELERNLAESPNPKLLAGRLFFERVCQYRARREDFSIETTLSGKTHLRLVERLLNDGWQVELFYLWVPRIDISIKRVAERVSLGGHDIPHEDIVRRYPRSIYNLLHYYGLLCSETVCLDNSGDVPEMISRQRGGEAKPTIDNWKTYNLLVQGANNER
uniref:Predicted ABC-type ATPase n=1 Tax=Candidatus Kentrum sp. DK TaxID=2126562 RepID=A0A450SGU0_9GAMM|nr:MAG: Predicted ABC-type ATPase [Candidatus Kentron sp. DK]